MTIAPDYGTAFNDWMVDKTGARWQFWFALGGVIGFVAAVKP